MDYDDNDFQSQNFQLIGEENKFPPSLRSFALPKFDLDDHLQVHLRFDSLAETDVLLGIRGQDNNWIEDFSSGTSGIEFSSSAADNCSISRHNNVWSEATSSESVEMLLKSVGEDEMNNRKATAMEDAKNLLSGVIDRGDPASAQVADVRSVIRDITQEDPSVPPDKFQISLSGENKDASGFQSEVPGMPQIITKETSGGELDASSLVDEIHSDGKIGAGQGISDETATQHLDNTSKICSVTSETLLKIVSKDDTLAMDFMKRSDGRCWDASEVVRGSPDSITCPSTQEQVMEGHVVINMMKRSDLPSSDAQTDRGQTLRHSEGNEQFMDDREVDTDLCTKSYSTFLEPTRDSLVLMSEECNMTGFSGNPDGLLEAIAYQVKAPKNGNKAGDNRSMQEHEMSILEIEKEKFVQTYYRDVSKENLPSQLTGHSDKGAANTSEVDVNASIHMKSETQSKEKDVEQSSEISPSDRGSENPNPAFEEKNVEVEEVKNVEESGSKLTDSEKVTLIDPENLNNAQVDMSSSVADKLPNVAEPSGVHTSSIVISPGEEDTGPIASSATNNFDNNDNAVMEEAGAAGKKQDNVGVTSVPPAKNLVHHGSVGDLASMVVGLSSLKECRSNDESHPSSSLVGKDPRKQMEVTSSLEPESIYSNVKEVKSVGISKENVDAGQPVEPEIVSDPVASPCSSPRGMTQHLPDMKVSLLDEAIKCHQSQVVSAADVVPAEQVVAISSQFSSEFVQSDEKEAKISEKPSLIESGGITGPRRLGESAIAENSPLSSTIRPQTVVSQQPSSYVETSVTFQSELQSLADRAVTKEEAIAVEGNLIICDSSAEEKDSSYKGEAPCEKDVATLSISAGLHRDNQEQTLPEPPPSVERTSASPVDSGTSTSTTLSRSNAEAHFSAIETAKPSLPETSCGSPTVISCCGNSQDEPEGGKKDNTSNTILGSKDNTASEDDKNFTFEVGTVGDLSVKDAGQWRPFPSLPSPELPKGYRSESGKKRHGGIKKAANEDKSSHATRSSNEKVTTPRSKTARGTSGRKKSIDSVGKSCTSSTPDGTVSNAMPLEEIKATTYTDSNRTKSSGSTVVHSSSLPDLNSSSATTLFHQPFTDMQQVQLRAQIFVYGSLIQSIPPDEACMRSAFGETDGGRGSWESVWRKSVERYQNQKSPMNSETPLISHSVARGSEQLTKCSPLQSKTLNISAGRNVGIGIAPALNATPPVPSPLWSISTPDGFHPNLPRGAQLDFDQALSPLQSHPSSQSRPFTSTTSLWIPQNPRPGPWAVSTQSPAINAATQYSTVPVIESVQVTPVRDISMPHPASVDLVSPSSLLPTPSPANVPPASVMNLETQKNTASPGNKNAATSPKPRKRKKAIVLEDIAETTPVSQPAAEPSSASGKTLPSASPFLPLSASTPPKVTSETAVSTSAHIPSTQYQIIGSGNTEQRVIFSEETGNKIDQAKLHAENAAALAASVVSHSQGIWNQLAAQKNSGLLTEVEEKLAAAAVAAAAAASVAKVAAAAAKIASDAALQAKMMADEALDTAKIGTAASDAVFDAGKNLTRLTPGSILKGKDKILGSSSIISAAREATRKRVEAASAATKRAENLDAIMKAAELAAEAVSQVGTIIAMGDPLPLKLSELVEAGPEGSWKTYRPASDKLTKAKKLSGEGSKDSGHSGHHYEQTAVNSKELHKTAADDKILHHEQPMQSGDNCQGLETGACNPSTPPNDSYEGDHSLSNLKEDVIQKGSTVEVISDEDGLRGGWFSARVLDVKDHKAHICYKNLLSDDGSGQLEEWISLASEINGTPRIRIAHPNIGMKHDGTRKRRREAVRSYAWEIGDRVDAWMRDGWWEGIVTGKNEVDETKLTVHFPAGGDTSLVRTWDLRPSLTWKDGQWIEWSRTREDALLPYEGDTPQEKRQRTGLSEAHIDAEVDGRGITKLSKKISPEDSEKAGELGPLDLSVKDKIFSVGKNASEVNISDARKVKRTGLQKEGSRVVFGVPKPGKKRKFMEVSKHYVADKMETSQGNDSLKFEKYLMPQAPRAWRNTSKIDSKGKRTGESKPLGVKSAKSQTFQTRSIPEKDNLSITALSTSNGEKNGHGSASHTKTGITSAENNSGKNSLEVVSFPGRPGSTGSLVAVSSVQSLSAIPASKKKTSSLVEAELGVKGRVTPALDKSTRGEKKPSESTGKAIPETIEPRRSNRKIQPTSRLLEGLQSSLIISKIPTLSHEKGSKTLHRSSSSRGNPRG